MLLWDEMVRSGCGPVGHWMELQIAEIDCKIHVPYRQVTWRVSFSAAFFFTSGTMAPKTQWPRVDLSKIIFFFAVASTLQIAIDELDLRGYM